MNILVIGSGGREHALVWKFSQSPKVKNIYCIPGNGGIADIAECIDIDQLDFSAIINFVKKNDVGITIVGPEAPLSAGIVDAFQQAGLAIFGPSKVAAELEGSKAFAKDFMKKYNIPTAQYSTFTVAEEAAEYVKLINGPCVVKADGLAAGKGVIVAMTEAEALTAIAEIMQDKKFGAAGQKVVIEEYLEGEEVSILAITDGKNIVPMLPAQDHKRIHDNDRGPNTGGMGAYAPAPVCDDSLLKWVQENVLKPTVKGMEKEGRTFKGVLYAGLMVTQTGPKVLEFNARFGDPETQPIIMLLDSDLLDLCQASINGTIQEDMLTWKQGSAVCVVVASGGYPEGYEKGKEICIGEIPSNTQIFHAGTAINKEGKLVTAGGRVLGVTSSGKTIGDAIENAYQAINRVYFDEMHFRTDIGKKAQLN